MRIVILTQDDPFFLARNLDYLFKILPLEVKVAACVVFDVSPFGKRETFTEKIRKTISIFGWRFTVRYGLEFLYRKMNPRDSVSAVLKKWHIPIVKLTEGVNKPSSLEIIRSFNPEVLVSIAGNQIFKKPLIDLAPKGCINLHTALLPKYRGLMPSFWVIKNQEKETGVSVFFVDEGIDSGPIIVQKTIEIAGRSQKQLITDTKKLGMEAIVQALVGIMTNSVSLIPNDESHMTYYSFPTRVDVQEFKKLGKKFY